MHYWKMFKCSSDECRNRTENKIVQARSGDLPKDSSYPFSEEAQNPRDSECKLLLRKEYDTIIKINSHV